MDGVADVAHDHDGHLARSTCRSHLCAILIGSGSADTDGAVDRLLAEWGSLPAIVAASEARIYAVGRDEAVAASISRFAAAAHHLLRMRLTPRTLISTTQALFDYLRLQLGSQTSEQLRVLYLNGRNELVRDEVAAIGTIGECKSYPREIIRRALELGAASLILAHNHPSGDPHPSGSDVRFTQIIQAMALMFDIVVLDHVIVGSEDCTSLQRAGLYDPEAVRRLTC